MHTTQSKLLITVAVIGCGLFVFCAAMLSGPGFYSQWQSVKDGMTQTKVSQLLGTPTRTGNGDCTGAGGRPVTRWEYQLNFIGQTVFYRVDFDYIGPGGAPAVFRTERVREVWAGPPWCRAKCRG